MNDFSKEYVELCKNDKVQKICPVSPFFDGSYAGTVDGLPGILRGHGEYVFYDEVENSNYKTPVWLPQSHDLDAEIVKICNNKGAIYKTYFDGHMSNLRWWVSIRIDDSNYYLSENDNNPLIAKISLLLKLLEGE